MKNRIFQKIIIGVLSCSAIFELSIPKINAEEKIQIAVKNKPLIDIVVTSNETNVDLSTFQTDIKTALKNKGFNGDLVNIQSIDRAEVSSNAADASTIFNSWAVLEKQENGV